MSRPHRPSRRGPLVDPVLMEILAAVAWLTVGTLGLGADGVGTLLLAVGIAAAVFVVVENRRRGSRVFDAERSALLLRLVAVVVVVVVVGSILLGLVSSSVFLPGVAAVATGLALLSLFRATGERPTQALGLAAVVLGVLSALVSTQTGGGFASQGLLGLVLGIALLASAADRIGLLTMLRDRGAMTDLESGHGPGPVLSLSDAGTRRTRPPRHLADLDAAGRREAVTALGLPAFRADQLSRHYFGRLEADPAAMTDLPAAVRETVASALFPELFTPTSQVSCDGGATRKTLWRAADGALVESVLMGYPERATVCVSSQAGCGMACPFCATGQGGLQRNMSTAEIVEQVRAAAADTRDGVLGDAVPARLSNVVFMGMGEPLANYRRVVDAVHRLCDPAPDGLGLSQRAVTVSTVGLVPAIHRLADEGLQVTLAVSLHTPDDELRDTLVPVNTRWPVREVMEAARRYADVTGRRVSIEYALIRDVNDQPWRADLLASLLTRHLGRGVHVNLIPLNPTPGSRWDASPPRVQAEFVRRLRDGGVAATVRDTRGREIAAACGQLAATGGPVEG